MVQAVLDCESIKKGCNCGRMAKSRGVVDITSCIESRTSRCSCLKKGQTCTRLCRCVNCKNASQVEKSPSGQHKGCTCGSMKNVKSAFVTCKDNVERKSRCPCLRLGTKCTSSCRCSNCGNNKDCPDKRSSNVTSITRKRSNPEKYKRMRGADYLANKGFVVSNGPWTNLESIILFVVIEVIEGSGNGVALNSLNVAELYNFVVSSEKVKEIGLAVTYKPFSSIVGKLSWLNEKHSLHESLMDSKIN